METPENTELKLKKVSVNGLNSQVDSVKEPISEPDNYSNTLKA